MTRPPATLRRRVALAFAALGLVLCGLFVGAVLVITEDYEAVLARAILKGQADDYVLRAASGLPAALPRTQRLAGYRDDAPERLASLAPGTYEDVRYDGQYVGVFDSRAGRLYFVVDLADIEHLETRLDAWMAAFVILGVALSAGLGWWLAGYALHPLRRLADAVERLDILPARTRLAEGLPADEVGRLATAIDDYQSRLIDSEARQQAFFADASHELRTPIAVVRGVTEVVLDDPPDDIRHTRRLERLDRGVRELSDLTEALLAVARKRPLQIADADLLAIARQTLGEMHATGWTVDAGNAAVHVAIAEEFPILLRMLVRRIVSVEPAGIAEVSEGGLRFTPAADTWDATVVLSSLVHRLAERVGCRVVVEPSAIRLELGAK
ncbi:sensor histidine kinase [Cognatilysobacter terrigena]|uniref:sensor histidine kinase n=1 Tax=Cognatilysobacter terrigena TaxID=2488749 RepID=UPI00105E57B6|nr:HAMP domain-containing sensor histidine kinase [Lysobacter terrigena]